MKKIIYITVAVLLACASILHIVVPRTQTVMAKTKQKPIYSVETTDKKVAISFDAAWGADNTEKIMDILDSYNVKATFFLVGFWIDKYPDMVKKINERGFEIGNHSLNHPQMSKLTKEQMKCEIEEVNKKIENLCGKSPTVFRPPFGDYNDTLVETVREENMHCIEWSIDSLDWKELGRQNEIDRVLKKVKGGDMIRFHNNAKYTPDALPEILETLISDGYSVTNVSDLIFTENYTVDNNGVQRK